MMRGESWATVSTAVGPSRERPAVLVSVISAHRLLRDEADWWTGQEWASVYSWSIEFGVCLWRYFTKNYLMILERFGALVALPEDLGLVLSILTVAHNHFSFRGSELSSQELGTEVGHTYTQANVHTHKININNFFKKCCLGEEKERIHICMRVYWPWKGHRPYPNPTGMPKGLSSRSHKVDS